MVGALLIIEVAKLLAGGVDAIARAILIGCRDAQPAAALRVCLAYSRGAAVIGAKALWIGLLEGPGGAGAYHRQFALADALAARRPAGYRDTTILAAGVDRRLIALAGLTTIGIVFLAELAVTDALGVRTRDRLTAGLAA